MKTFGEKKEIDADTCCSKGESQKRAKMREARHKGHRVCDSIYMRNPE